MEITLGQLAKMDLKAARALLEVFTVEELDGASILVSNKGDYSVVDHATDEWLVYNAADQLWFST